VLAQIKQELHAALFKVWMERKPWRYWNQSCT